LRDVIFRSGKADSLRPWVREATDPRARHTVGTRVRVRVRTD
jgi:hypothetical protein